MQTVVYPSLISVILIQLLTVLFPTVSASQGFNTPLRLTTHTAEDFQPAVSPDGGSAAFVSNRTGNSDIWLVTVNGGPARQITAHTSSDTDPAWSRDGKMIAFTSLRNDAKGDIWVVDLKDGGERRVTDGRYPESYPSWFPDNRRIAFSRGEEVWIHDIDSGKEKRLFRGLNPRISPDGRHIAYVEISGEHGRQGGKKKGMICAYRIEDKIIVRLTSGEYSDGFPSWSPDGGEIYFSRYAADSNSDGIIDLRDNPSLWKTAFSEDSLSQSPGPFRIGERQITSGASYDLFPSASTDRIVYASGIGEEMDIYSLPIDGEIALLKTPREQLDLGYRRKEPLRRIMAFRNMYLSGVEGPETGHLLAEARYQTAMTLLASGQKDAALRELGTLIGPPYRGTEYSFMAEIQLARTEGMDEASSGRMEEAEKSLERLRLLADRPEAGGLRAYAHLAAGDIYVSMNNSVKALDEYKRVGRDYPNETDAVAQSRFKTAGIYLSYGDEPRIMEIYISIIRDFPQSVEWGTEAAIKALSIIEKSDDEQERISRYREIAARYRDVPYLPVMAQYRIGERHQIMGRNREAVEEYRKALEWFPTGDGIRDEVALAMAESLTALKDYDQAAAVYRKLVSEGKRQAERPYRQSLLKKARTELSAKEPSLAVKTYKTVIDMDYGEVKAHRGLIEAYVMMGEAEKAVEIYREEVGKNPDSDVARYALGLSLTYLDGYLDAAETEIKKALAINYSSPFPHQTLGWIYEVKDRLGISKDLANSVDEYQTALALLEADSRTEAADLHLNIGNGFLSLGSHEKAYRSYRSRIESGIPFDDPRRKGLFYENIGNASSRTGRYDEADKYLQKALDMAVALADRKWELKIMGEIGLVYQEKKDYAGAAERFSKALNIAEEERDEANRGLLLRNIGYNLYQAGRADEAIRYFNMGLGILSAVDRPIEEGKGVLSFQKAVALGREGSEAFTGFDRTGEEKLIYSYLGKSYADIGEYEGAMEYLNKKLALMPEQGKETERGIVLNNLGFLHYLAGDRTAAIYHFKASLDASKRGENFTGEMVNVINIGLVAAEKGLSPEIGRMNEAMNLQQDALDKIKSGEPGKDYRQYIENNLGLLCLGLASSPGKSGSVRATLESMMEERELLKDAAAHFEAALAHPGTEGDPWLKSAVLLNLASALARLGDDEGARRHLDFSMRSAEANSLTEIQWRGLRLQALLEPEKRIGRLEAAVSLMEKGEWSPTESETVFKELISLIFNRGGIEDAFSYAERISAYKLGHEARKAGYPLPETGPPASARDVQWFLDDKTALIRYMTMDDSVLIWVLDSEKVRGMRVEVSGSDLRRRIGVLLSSLDFNKPTDSLSELIISPISSHLFGKSRLYIIPDGPLSAVPFQALRVNDEFVGKSYEIAILHDAAALNQAYENRNLNKVNILISAGKNVPEDYAEAVGSMTPVYAVLKDGRTGFAEKASNYGIIHITDNFTVNKEVRFRSYMELGRDRFYLTGLPKFGMNPNLVVLTSPDRQGIGSLTAAVQPFIYTGAQSVMVKTIPSDADSEMTFMKEFYSAFRTGSAAGAMKKAAHILREQGLPTSAWAGYSLYGFLGMDREMERDYASGKVADTMDRAIAAYSEGDWKEAVRRFEEGLVFLRAMGEVKNTANIYQALAKASANSGDYKKGVHYQEEFIKVSEKSLPDKEKAEAYRVLGVLHSRTGSTESAADSVKKAIGIWESTGDRRRLMEGYRTLSLLDEQGGRHQAAMDSLEKARLVAEKTGDLPFSGRVLQDSGRILYLHMNLYERALMAYKEALDIYRRTGEKGRTASLLTDIGLVHERTGMYEEARKNYIEGISIAGEINDVAVRSKGVLYLANVAWHTGDYDEAFRYQREALQLATELKDKKQEAMAHNLAGLIYMNLGILEKALESLSVSLSMSLEAREMLDAAAAHNNIGIVRREMGDAEGSIKSFKDALAIDTELGTRWGMAYDLRNLGISLERLGRTAEASEKFRAALSLSKETGDRKNEAMTIHSLAMLMMNAGDLKGSLALLRKAEETGRELNLKEVVWRSLKGQATILAKTGRESEAYGPLKEAIEIVEGMRGRIRVDDYRSGFLENKMDLYEDMVLLLLRTGRETEAFEYSERARSRGFIDMLGNQKLNLRSAAGSRLIERERELRGRIDSLEERGRTDSTLSERLVQAKKEYESLLAEIKEESAELVSFIAVTPPSIEDIQAMLPEGTVLLEYLVTGGGVVVWTVKRSGVGGLFVPVEKGLLREKIGRYRELMETLSPVEKESKELYDILIRPVESHLSGSGRVGIIPHDVLHYLSFSSLHDGGRYFAESYPIFYSPSASVLKMVMEKRRDEDRPEPAQWSILVLANPDLGDSAYDLPFTEKEAGSIAREFPNSKVLLKKEATETGARGYARDSDILHFASHGIYDGKTPLFSKLKLARDDANNGDLTAAEVFSLELRASLVVMSACQTGLGKVTGGDEIIGLNRAFIYAGTPSVISTLWRVNDASSAMIVKRFYRNFRKLGRAESLRLAQTAVMEYYPHPAYWAGFSLTGDYR